MDNSNKLFTLKMPINIQANNCQHYIVTILWSVMTRFGLVIRFIEHLYIQFITTSNYSATANLHSAIQFSTHLILLSLPCLKQFYGNDFQWQMFPFLWVLELSL
jgi:hypothetical protein